MEERIRERCIYCGGEIVYSALEKYVKCPFCGKTFSVLKFRSEQAKIKRALEEGEKAKAELAEAEARRQEAQDRLNKAVADLTGLRKGQDTLSRLMQALADTQAQSDEKLALLQSVAARLLETQDDLLAKLDVQKEIVSMLHGLELDAEERRRLESEFIVWSQSIHEEDRARLERIQGDAAKLLSGQDALNDRVDALRQTVDENGRMLSEFRGEYRSDKVKTLEHLYHQADGFQRERRFDQAAESYRQMLVKDGADAEILWRLVMCRYCLEYQRDENGRLIPIILNPDLSAPDEVLERRELLAEIGADAGFYREELARIDAILDRYREVRQRVRYDVFISVKQNVDGHHTPDSDTASDLYDYIQQKGLRVFNSRRTQIPAGQECEPYIISALMSAKVLIVVGTKPEHMNAQWVRNEWSRFQWLQRSEMERSGRTERVLFCYLAGGMKPGQIPKALNPDREAIIDGENAAERLDAALAFLLPHGKAAPAQKPEPTDEMSLDGVLNQMTAWLHNGQFEQVTRRYKELTERRRFLNSAKIHIYALCAQRRVKQVEELVQSRTELKRESLFQLAKALCSDPVEQAWLDDLAARNRAYRKGRGGKTVWVIVAIALALAIAAVLFFTRGNRPSTRKPAYSTWFEEAANDALGK